MNATLSADPHFSFFGLDSYIL